MSQPITTCDVSKGNLGPLKWAMVSMQGWRIDMEDDHIIFPDFTENIALFAVFDGHGGPEVARIAAKLYPNFLKSNEYFIQGDYQRALVSSFERFDLFMMSEEGKKVFKANNTLKTDIELCAGCTAIVALVEKNWESTSEWNGSEVKMNAFKDLDLRQRAYKNWKDYSDSIKETVFNEKKQKNLNKKKWKVWIANAGDCRALLIQKNKKVFPLNEEHKPFDPRERKRIENAGGLIIKMRIDENLNLSRAMGDFHYKNNFSLPFDQQLIISKPDIYELVVDADEHSYLFLGCDGVFEVLSDSDIGSQIYKNEKTRKEKAKEIESENEPSIIDEIKEEIKKEEEVDFEKNEELNNLEQENNEELQENQGESNSGESLKSSSVKNLENEKEEEINVEAKNGKEEIEDKNEESQEINEMVENVKQVLMRTVAKPGQITMGMGYDNMSAICVKLFV